MVGQDVHIFQGLKRDNAPIRQDAKFMWDALNVRLTNRDGNTMLALTTEKGTTFENKLVFSGDYVGHCVLGNYLVIFSAEGSKSYITRFDKDLNTVLLYRGSLGFSKKNPIQALGVYETELVQKVYWIDDEHQPRLINIAKPELAEEGEEWYPGDNPFDFVPTLDFQAQVSVSRSLTGGSFQQGVIQYALTYYNKYGQESNIFYISPVLPITFKDRGAKTNESVPNSFTIDIRYPEQFDYVRVYSIHRTTIDTTPEVKQLADLKITSNKLSFVDTGTYGTIVDPTFLLYVGGEQIIAKTMEPKDGTLFLGNLTYERPSIRQELKDLLSDEESTNMKNSFKEINVDETLTGQYYTHNNQLLADNISYFRAGEHYRLGIQFLHNSGKWSEPIVIRKDYTVPLTTTGLDLTDKDDSDSEDTGSDDDVSGNWTPPIYDGGVVVNPVLPSDSDLSATPELGDDGLTGQIPKLTPQKYKAATIGINNRPTLINDVLSLPYLEFQVPLTTELQTELRKLKEDGFVKARTVVVYPENERLIVAQGLLCPTVFNYYDRNNDGISHQSSWFLRPFIPDTKFPLNTSHSSSGNTAEFRHLHTLPRNRYENCEVQSNDPMYKDLDGNDVTVSDLETINVLKEHSDIFEGTDEFLVDQNTVTLHSPDMQFDTSYPSMVKEGLKLRIVGMAAFTSNVGDIRIQTSTPMYQRDATGIQEKQEGTVGEFEAAHSLISGPFYRDVAVVPNINASDKEVEDDSKAKDRPYKGFDEAKVDFMVYPWHRNGSLNSDYNRGDDNGTRSAVLQTKIISNLKFAKQTFWLDKPLSYDITTPQFWGTTTNILMVAGKPYLGNIDTLVTRKYDYRIRLIPPKSDTYYQDYNDELQSTDPIRMKYSSGPHSVFQLNTKSGELGLDTYEWILPQVYNTLGSDVTGYKTTNLNSVENTAPAIITAYFYGTSSSPSIEGFESSKAYQTLDSGMSNSLSATSRGIIVYKGTSDSRRFAVGKFTGYKSTSGEDETTKLMEVSYELYSTSYKVGTLIKYKDTYNGSFKYLRITSQVNSYIYNYADVTETVASNASEIKKTIKQEHFDLPAKYKSYFNTSTLTTPYLLIGELYRESADNSFGGDSESDMIVNNLWLPASPAVDIKATSGVFAVPVVYGDTYYQRYDCLKTYASTDQDPNSIIEIGSFMCETRVNMDGRCDINRGLNSNLNITPENFNILNTVYSQKDNYFNYRMLDSDYYKVDSYPNQITWSQEKSNASEVDIWTQISMTSTLDLDGSKGQLTALATYVDSIFALQERSFSKINFNNRVQIPTSDNVPIEISNNYKVDGVQVYSDQIGCQNKWSVCNSPMGLYFIDNNTDSIYRFNANGLDDISSKNYMRWWLLENKSTQPWSLIEGNTNNVRTFYDSVYKDVYFVPGPKYEDTENTLGFSELLDSFISKYSYDGSIMFNFDSKFFAIKNDNIYRMFAGKHNWIFDGYVDTSISFISNDNPTLTKIFDTVELRADTFDENGNITHTTPFDSIRADNEYQNSKDGNDFKYKFRVWRALVPRQGKLERIRNPWAKITLTKKGDGTQLLMSDLMVKYTY